MRRAIFVLPVLPVLFGLVAPVAAEDAADPAALVLKIEELRKAKDESGMKAEVEKVPEIFNAATDPAVKGSLADALGKVAKDKKAGEAREAAVTALAALNDKKLAWKELKGLMPDVKVEEPTALDLAVVKASGTIAEDGAIDLLLTLGEKAKATPLAKEAMQALSGYTAADKKDKVKILDAALGLAVRIKPSSGGQSNKNVSPEAQARFQEVGGAIVHTANTLTGRKVNWEEWEVLYKENKKSLGKLLPE
jgi:hypothetical protein